MTTQTQLLSDETVTETTPLQLPGSRRRINIVAVIVNVFVPWLLFILCYFVMSFSLHYKQPNASLAIVVICAAIGIIVGILAIRRRRKAKDPTWFGFGAFLILLAVILGTLLGDINFWTNMQPFYDVSNLATYSAVDPAQAKGTQHMDSGKVFFTSGSRIEEKYSIGFKNLDLYCVAPITNGAAVLDNYDYWAVGVNCCSADGPTFTCGEAKNGNARAGLRLMRDDQRPFYRLAVTQAESAYSIKSTHPLFFYWVGDPVAEVAKYKEDGYRWFLLSIFSYFAGNLVSVICAVIAFSRLGAKRRSA